MSNDSGTGFLTIRRGWLTISLRVSVQNPILVLASASPRRRELLHGAGVPFSVQPSDIEEQRAAGEDAEEYTLRAARLKANAVAGSQPPGTWVLAADTTVVLDGTVLGKPKSEADAAKMLRLLSGRRHRVLTAVVLVQTGGDEPIELLCETSVWFRPLDAATIHEYLATGEPMDKAGAYAVQGVGGLFVRAIEGSPHTVVGLPTHRLAELFDACGLDLWDLLS